MDNVPFCSVEKLTEAIRMVENLRTSVYVVFDELVGGKTINDGIKDHRTINDKKKGEKMVANLHMNLKNGVHKALAMLEASIANLGRCPISGLTTNPGFCQLSLDATSQEDLEFYEDLHEDYLRSYQISENSVSMFKRLTLNMKLPNTHELEPPAALYPPISAPRSRIEAFVATLNQRYSSSGNPASIKLSLMQTSSGTMLRAIVGGMVLKACIVMTGITVDRVVVHSFNEETSQDNIWPPSKFIVFQRLTEVANAAALYSANNAQRFFYWLTFYQHLYSQPCKLCGKILCDENNRDRFLPPIRRDFVHPELAYHLSCYQDSDSLQLAHDGIVK